MIGIGLIIFICIWGAVAIWIGVKLSNIKFFSKFTKNKETGQPKIGHFLLRCLFVALVFISPFADQIIAYPQWQKLCSHTGDFEYGPGIDEKKAFGRQVVTKFEHHETTIFPFISVLYTSVNLYDAKTQELILKKPHAEYFARGFIYLPSSSGDRTGPLLTSCSSYRFKENGQDLYKKLQLTESN